MLASASPRRVELLNNLGLDFLTIASTVGEDFERALSPSQIVIELALRKAKAVSENLQGQRNGVDAAAGERFIIIGADTIVVKDHVVLGKPVSSEEAREMLSFLSGKAHEVYTGVALIPLQIGMAVVQPMTSRVVSQVRFRKLGRLEIDAYVATGEPMDKAGAYALQGTGAALVESVQGCYTNIIGLPIPELVSMLRKLGVIVLGE